MIDRSSDSLELGEGDASKYSRFTNVKKELL